jgi:hypothetical protein
MEALILAAALPSAGGCTSPVDYFRNRLKVGPHAGAAAGPTARHWIEEGDAA